MLLLVRLSPWDLLCLLQVSDCWRGDPVPLCVPNISRIYPHQPLSPCCLCWLLNEVWDPCIFFVCSFRKEKRWACLAGHELTPAALLRAAPCRRPPARGHSAGWTPVFSQQDSSVKTRLWLLSWLEGLLDEIGGTRARMNQEAGSVEGAIAWRLHAALHWLSSKTRSWAEWNPKKRERLEQTPFFRVMYLGSRKRWSESGRAVLPGGF